jgi:hypothetical protein
MQRPAAWLLARIWSYSKRARAKRAEWLTRYIRLQPDDLVLDLGGGSGDHFHAVFPDHKKVVIADVLEKDLELARERYGYQTVQLPDGDTKLPFETQRFDVVFCSSVLEHVTGPKEEEWNPDPARFAKVGRLHQWAFADEIRRIAKAYYVQTPYRYFLIECHTCLPGIIVLLPRPLLVRLVRFTNTFWPKQTSPDWRLLTVREFTKMFPDATIEIERSLGCVKSLMAIKAPQRKIDPIPIGTHV